MRRTPEAGIFLKQAQSGILDQTFRVSSRIVRELGEFSSLLGCEMDFIA
jgi:hypothetical protein